MKRAGAPVKAGGKNKPYARPEPITSGEVLTDIHNKKWKLGKSIGAGGFGDIYLASDESTTGSKAVTEKNAQFVVKIEPHANGPLFVEINFYLRAAKAEMIKEWETSHGEIGMPRYVASGSHSYKDQKYRFLVIPRFGQDLHKFVDIKPGKRFSCRTVQALSLQVLNTLEYIHSKEYVHGDIKASNLMLGLSPSAPAGKKGSASTTSSQVFLLDYGLAARFVNTAGEHLKYGPDARKAHNGTLEYTSRDSHIGAMSRRGDLEILGYNLLEWIVGIGNLPWTNKDTPDLVHKKKQVFMGSVSAQVKKLYGGSSAPVGLDLVEKFLKYVTTLGFEEKPNYNYCREILKKGLPKSGARNLWLDDVVPIPSASSSSSSAAKKRSPPAAVAAAAISSSDTDEGDEASGDEEDEEDVPASKKIKLPEENLKRTTRTTKKVQKNFDWNRVLSSNPEKIIHSANSVAAQGGGAEGKKAASVSPPAGITGTPTPAMMKLLLKKKENAPALLNSAAGKSSRGADLFEGTSTLTPAMKEVLMKTKKKKLRKSMSMGELPTPTSSIITTAAKSKAKAALTATKSRKRIQKRKRR